MFGISYPVLDYLSQSRFMYVTDYPLESTNFPITMTAHYPFLHFKRGKLVHVFPLYSPAPTSDS